jgi:AcrR family transcriptional regulator
MTTIPARRRLTRDESQALTRERLIDAARDLVATKGLESASVRDIAEAAGYSQGAFYSNFARKEDIVLALARRHKAEDAAKLEALLAAVRREPARTMDFVAEMCAGMNAGEDWSRLVLELDLYASRNPEFTDLWAEVNDAFRDSLASVIDGMFKALARTPPAPCRDIASGLMALSHGLAVRRGGAGEDAAGGAILLYVRALVSLAGAEDERSGRHTGGPAS